MMRILSILSRKNVRGIAGSLINNPKTDIMEMNPSCLPSGIKMDNFEPALKWSDLKKNSDGMVPVIVQDYRTDEVLMLAYMNEEAFDTTINIGKMTYYSRSRNELWTKGLTSGHIQYVKSLTADCDYDTILAKVSRSVLHAIPETGHAFLPHCSKACLKNHSCNLHAPLCDIFCRKPFSNTL